MRLACTGSNWHMRMLCDSERIRRARVSVADARLQAAAHGTSFYGVASSLASC